MDVNVQTVCSLTAVSLLTVFGVYLYFTTNKKKKIPNEWMEVGKVTKLLLYPLKSGHRIDLQTAECSDYGLVSVERNALKLRDKSFVVYGEDDHEFKSAKTHQKIMSIEVSIHDKDHMVFDAPQQRPLYVKIPTAEDRDNLVSMRVSNNGQEIMTIDCGDEAAAWLSRYILGKPTGFRLGYHDASHQFNESIKKSDISYDGYHLINETSIKKLNSELEAPISIDNFRPNIMVQGESIAAFSEETWEWIKIGDALFRNVSRKTTSNVEELNFEKDDIRDNGVAPVMGIKMDLEKHGTINVGDAVFISKETKK